MKGVELRNWRERHSLTQEQLAERLQVRGNTIARWERDERQIPPYLFFALQHLEDQLQGENDPAVEEAAAFSKFLFDNPKIAEAIQLDESGKEFAKAVRKFRRERAAKR